MLSKFKLITVTHHKLNVNELDKFVIKYNNEGELDQKLQNLKSQIDLDELFYLATCNRVQILIFDDKEIDLDFCHQIFKNINPKLQDADFEQAEKFIDIHHGLDAIDHIFSVCSSIDSLVVGEREIIRQYRQAYEKCLSLGITGDNLRLVDKYTVQAAKDVYANTKIGEKPVSIVSLAIQKLLQADLNRDARIILVGAGETNKLVGKFLKKYEFSNITIFNRSLDNAKKLSSTLNARAYHLSELAEYKEGFDCIISCTGSPDIIISENSYSDLLNGEQSEKLIIDLAVPNNVDKTIATKYSAKLIDIEQLRILANENLAYRKDEVVEAREILKSHVQNFDKIYQQRQIEKALTQLPPQIKAVKERALEQVYKKEIEELEPEAQKLIAEMMDYMEKKCVGIPMKVARAAVD